jgi:hypothetical protein
MNAMHTYVSSIFVTPIPGILQNPNSKFVMRGNYFPLRRKPKSTNILVLW